MNHWITGLLHHRFIDASVNWIHWFIDSLIHLLTSSPFHWLIDSLNHSSMDLLNHRFNDSSVHWLQWFRDSLVQRLTTSNSLIHWIINSFMHWFTALIHWLIGSLIHTFIDSWIYWFIRSVVHGFFHGVSATICSCVGASPNFNNSLLLHCENFPIGHWFLAVISYFRNNQCWFVVSRL